MKAFEIETRLGAMLLADRGDGLGGLWFIDQRHFPPEAENWPRAKTAAIETAAAQLADYFAGRRRAFELPLANIGTPFQRKVWQRLLQIPFGQRLSYGELAANIGQPAASRAVGAAVGRNPWSIVVPCHRVVGSQGQMSGYAGGLERKRALLELEGAAAVARQLALPAS